MAFAAMVVPATAEIVPPPLLDDATLISAALTLCVEHGATTRTTFEQAATQRGFMKAGTFSAGTRAHSFENEAGVLGSLAVTGLEGKPALFECSVSSTGAHDHIEKPLKAALEDNYGPVEDFPLNDGWVFRKDGIEFVVSVTRSETLNTTAVTAAFSGVNR